MEKHVEKHETRRMRMRARRDPHVHVHTWPVCRHVHVHRPFIARDDLPVAWRTAATVVEDETRGVRVELNGSDIDSEFVTFLLTRLPSKGKLFVVDRSGTRKLIESAFSGFEVEPS